MHLKRFSGLGHWVFRFRRWIIASWCVAILACLPFIADVVKPFQTTGFVVNGSESDAADDFINKQLGFGHNQIVVLYRSQTLKATDPAFMREVKRSLSDLKHFSIPHEILLPEKGGPQISHDEHVAYAVILFKTAETISPDQIRTMESLIKKQPHLSIQYGGEPIFVERVEKQTQKDLFHSDAIAVPVTILTMLFIFGTLVAAMVPLGIGGGCALLILISLYALGHVFTLSIFTLNIALLLGLCLSLDYSLFIIARFRDELTHPQSIADAINKTLATAGNAVFFSGIAVFISLSALLFFPINILFSIGIGGLVAVFVAVSAALTLLPAVLCVLNHRINALPVRKLHAISDDPNVVNPKSGWYKIASHVVKRPITFSFFTLFFLLILGYTVLNIKVGISDFQILPKDSENQQFYDTYKKYFYEQELSPIKMVVSTDKGNILSKGSISKLYRLVEEVKDHPSVHEVNSIVSIDKKFNKAAYQAMYHPDNKLNRSIRSLLNRTSGADFTVIDIISRYPPDSTETINLIHDLQKLNPGKNMHIRLTGMPVINLDVLTSIKNITPYAAAWIMILTYIILMVLLQSLFLPFKAILMNILSLCASYGVLVFIFQEGHFHTFLQFTPQGMIDITLIIIIFCALFGFSMDYEVFLLSRIHEAYLNTHNNDKSIIFGIVKSSRIITSAALIVIFLCGAFMVAQVFMVKQFGLGIAVAIFVDAFLIRTLLVPATMTLVKDWNWYLPNWIKKIVS